MNVVVISADPVFGGALSAALSGAPGVEQCRLAGEIDQAMASEDDAGVFVLHVSGHTLGDYFDLAAVAPVLVLGKGGSDEMIEAVDSGAMGYLEEGAPLDDIVDAVQSLAKGLAIVEPDLLGALLHHVVERRRDEQRAREALEVLTPRQREVFGLLARGLDSTTLAETLFISRQTARTHTQRVMAKLGLHSRAQLVALAARCGLDLSAEEAL